MEPDKDPDGAPVGDASAEIHQALPATTLDEVDQAYAHYVVTSDFEAARNLIDREIEHAHALLEAIGEFERSLHSD